MKKKLYIIPGFGETSRQIQYRQLKKVAESKGYEVVNKNPNWKKPLSEQVFPIEPDSVLFGFSLGAALAYMIGQRFSCKKVILGSMTPFQYFGTKEFEKIVGKRIASDLQKNTSARLKTKAARIYGEIEFKSFPKSFSVKSDTIIPLNDHELSPEYIGEIEKLL